MSQTIFYLSVLFTVFCALALLLAPILLRQSPENQRVLDVVANNRAPAAKIRCRTRFCRWRATFAESLAFPKAAG